MRGGGVTETGGLGGALGTCAPCRLMPCAGGCAGGAVLAAGTDAAGRGGIVTPGGAAAMGEGDAEAAGGETGVAATGGVGGIFGGMTTTAGGRCAATVAGVTSLGAGGSIGLGAAGLAATTGASSLASIDGAATGGFAAGGFATGRITGRSAASLCCVIARSTSPGREICERSILVLISSSPWLAGRAALLALDPDSPRERKCFRTSSASCSSKELECVFFSVTPTETRASSISLLLTSSSRARSLIRIFIRSRFPFPAAQSNATFAYLPHGTVVCTATNSRCQLAELCSQNIRHPGGRYFSSSGDSPVEGFSSEASSGDASS